jgi:Cu-Zn family superoxide dismutase
MYRKILVSLAATALVACGGTKKEEKAPPKEEPKAAGPAAFAEIKPASGSDVKGVITFVQEGNDLKITADISGAKPGKHGIHIHEKGDCSAPDASSAGGHFNPTSEEHGGPMAAQHPAGDLGNIEVGEDGKGHLELKTRALRVPTADNSVVGHAIIVHANEDDLTSQPAGNAGDRIACGVIEAGEPPAAK